MKKIAEKAFTLVELLIVIGIIGVLAVTFLISVNPGESQRKTRDVKRLRDAATLQAIAEQIISDGTATTCIAGTVCSTAAAGTSQSQTCGTNLFGRNVCNYAKMIPTDPLNNRRGICRNGAGTANDCLFVYYFSTDAPANNQAASNYEVNVRMESATNATKVSTDGGDNPAMFELYTNVNTLIGNALNP